MAELENTLGAGELVEWVEYYRVEPWGQWRDNAHAGMIASVIANVHRSRNGKAYTIKDFMLTDAETQRNARTRATLDWMESVAKRKGTH